jgi:hypothetical protein
VIQRTGFTVDVQVRHLTLLQTSWVFAHHFDQLRWLAIERNLGQREKNRGQKSRVTTGLIEFNASSCLAAGFRTRRAIILRSVFLPPGMKRPSRYVFPYGPHHSGNQKLILAEKNGPDPMASAFIHGSSPGSKWPTPERLECQTPSRAYRQLGDRRFLNPKGTRTPNTYFWSEEVGLFWRFVSSSKRGICPMVGGRTSNGKLRTPLTERKSGARNTSLRSKGPSSP